MTRHPLLALAAIAALALVGLGACRDAPESTVLSSPAASGVTNVADIDVTTNVKTALLQAESLKTLDITVVTTQGDVRLTGVLDNQAQVDEALRIARAADGAHTVHDELTVRK